MKKILVSSCLIWGLTSSILADESTNSGWTPSVTLRSVVASKYLAFGSGGMLYNSPVVQSDLFISFRNGFYLDLWNSTPFKGHDDNFGWEQDLGIGWAGPLSTFGLNGFASDMTLDIGNTYFDEPGLLTLGAKDVIFNHVKLSKAFRLVAIYGKFGNYTVMPGSPYEGGNLFSVGASKGISLFKGLLDASTSLELTYDDGGFGCDNGLLLYGNVELDWRLTKHLMMILPQVNYYAPLTTHDIRPLDAVVFGGFSYRF